LKSKYFAVVLTVISISAAPISANGSQLISFKENGFTKAQRVCNAPEKALIINYNGEINKLITQRAQLRKKLNGYLSEEEKLLLDTQLLTLDIKISNSTSERDFIEKSCNAKGVAKKIKVCTKSEITQITNWAKDFELKQRELKLQWDKVIAAQNLIDSKRRIQETSSNQKVYMELRSSADVKKQEFDALNAGCRNSGVTLVPTFNPVKIAADKTAADKAATEKLAADKAASEKIAGASIPKVGDCWDYSESDYENISGNRSPVPCTQQHTRVTYKVAFWPKTTKDAYELYSQGSFFSLGGAVATFCGSVQRYEENLKSGTGLSTGTFLLPDKEAWNSGARWINCLEGLKVDGAYVPWSVLAVTVGGKPVPSK
jgi:hypothetical protein